MEKQKQIRIYRKNVSVLGICSFLFLDKMLNTVKNWFLSRFCMYRWAGIHVIDFGCR